MSTTTDSTSRHSGRVLPAPATMASPSWWGADSERHRMPPGPAGEPATFVKVIRPVSTAYVDVTASFSATRAAGLSGLGPRVLQASAPTRTIVLEDLTAHAKTATLDDFLDPGLLERYLSARRSVQALQVPHVRRASVFDDLRHALGLARRHAAALPADLAWMLRVLDDAESRITASGVDSAFCHGDGNVSNVLLTGSGEVLLLDWDVAAVMDPAQDTGVVLTELAATEDDARALFERIHGAWDAALFARARVYGAADLVRWALIGAYVDSAEPGTLEYSKFSDWQFMRARWALGDRAFDNRLQDL